MVGLGLGRGGCRTQITSQTPAGKEIAALQLDEAFPYTHLWLSRLSAGKYRPLGQDAHGTFYEGPSRCYSQRILKPGPFAPDSSRNFVIVADCAVYLPKDAAMPGKVLVVTGSERIIQLDNPDASEV